MESIPSLKIQKRRYLFFVSFRRNIMGTHIWKTIPKASLIFAPSVPLRMKLKWFISARRVTVMEQFWKSWNVINLSNYSLSLQINENIGFNAPLNAPFLGKYIYVGFLPRSIAARRSIQGYRAGSKDWEFNNCDANPNSYIAFFYNNSPLQNDSYHKRCCYNKYMRNWIDVSTRYSLPIPDDYFRFFEMHMGGCGGYVVPNYGTLSDIVGAVPGFRFGESLISLWIATILLLIVWQWNFIIFHFFLLLHVF